MKKLKHNSLESATTEIGFVKAINENSGAETVALIREVEVNGETVKVEGITPHGMKKIINKIANSVSFVTPAENYIDNNGATKAGLVGLYNSSLETNSVSVEDEEDITDPDDGDLNPDDDDLNPDGDE